MNSSRGLRCGWLAWVDVRRIQNALQTLELPGFLESWTLDQHPSFFACLRRLY